MTARQAGALTAPPPADLASSQLHYSDVVRAGPMAETGRTLQCCNGVFATPGNTGTFSGLYQDVLGEAVPEKETFIYSYSAFVVIIHTSSLNDFLNFLWSMPCIVLEPGNLF